MNLLELLMTLASTPLHAREINDMLGNQSESIQQAFITHDAMLLKQQFRLTDSNELFANERTVVQI